MWPIFSAISLARTSLFDNSITISRSTLGRLFAMRQSCSLTVAVVLVSLAWHERADAIVIGKTYVTKHGRDYGRGADKSKHEVKFRGNLRELVLSVDGFDVDNANEVSIYLNDSIIGYLRVTGNNKSRRTYLSLGALSRDKHTLRFQAADSEEKWGVGNVRVETRLGGQIKLTKRKKDTRRYGFKFGLGRHIGGANIRFANLGTDATLSIKGFDIDKPDSVGVYLNGNWIAHLQQSKNRKFKTTKLTIPAALQEDKNTLTLRVKQLGDMWGVTNLLLTPAANGAPPPEPIQDEQTPEAPSPADPSPSDPTPEVPDNEAPSPQTPTVSDNYDCNGVDVAPTDDLAQVAASYGPGATFCVRSGVHRPGRILAQHDQKFICEKGAVLNGAVPLTGNWNNENGLWVFDGAPSAVYGNGVPASGRGDALRYRNDLFIDNKPYRRVSGRDGVNAEAVYFDGNLMYEGTFYQEGGRIFVAANPNGRLVEFGQQRWAFFASPGQADRVLVDGCIVEKYATDDIEGAIEIKNTTGWTLKNVTARLNHSGGVRTGVGTKILGGRYIRNGQIGIMGAGNGDLSANTSRNIQIDNVEVAYNNFLEFDPHWHAGGIKYFKSDDVKVTNSNIHHNYGVGLWFDFDGQNSIVRNNDISHNSSIGLEIEAVFNGEVTGNRLECNARLARHSLDWVWFWGSALMVKNSQGFNVTNNTLVVDQGQGVGLIDNTDRGYHPTLGQRRSINNRIENNTITFTNRSRSGYFDGITGVESDAGAKGAGMDASSSSAGNVLRNNTYVFSAADFAHWRFDGNAYRSADVPSQWEQNSNFRRQSAEQLSGLCR